MLATWKDLEFDYVMHFILFGIANERLVHLDSITGNYILPTPSQTTLNLNGRLVLFLLRLLQSEALLLRYIPCLFFLCLCVIRTESEYRTRALP